MRWRAIASAWRSLDSRCSIAGFYIGYTLNISSTLAARVAMWQSLWDNGARGGEQIAQAIWGLSTGGLLWNRARSR